MSFNLLDQFTGNRWWQGRRAPHEGITDILTRLQSDVEERDRRWRIMLGLYYGCEVESWGPGGGTGDGFRKNAKANKEERLALNPIESGLSTLASRFAASKISPRVLTSTTSPDKYSLKQQAQRLERLIMGEWSRGRVYQQAPSVFMDGGILGLGAYKVFPAHGRVCYERTFPGELIVDEKACMTTGQPRSLYQVKWVPAEVLVERFAAKDKDAIARNIGSPCMIYAQQEVEQTITDLVPVYEAWHLPSGPAAKDGLHAIVLNDWTLMSERWTSQRFPFAFFSWAPAVLGFFQPGLAERAAPLQAEVNKLLEKIQLAHHLYATPQTWVQDGSVDKAKMTNLPGAVNYYKGTAAPTSIMPHPVSSQIYSWVDTLYNRVFEGLGISQLSAMSKKPAGIESGVALRELSDNESGRFAGLSAAWEQCFVDLAELTIEACKNLHTEMGGEEEYEERDGDDGPRGYVGRYVGKDGYEDIPWGEVDMDRDAYELQVFPSSYLPHTPAGRLATVQDLLQAGFIDAKMGMSLLSFPDLDSFVSMSTAQKDAIERQISRILADGEMEKPEVYQDLELALSMATSALVRARCDGVDEGRLRMLIDYIDQADELLKPPAPPPGEDPMGAGAPPMGPGGPPPLPGVAGEMPVPIPEPQAADLPLSTPEAPLG